MKSYSNIKGEDSQKKMPKSEGKLLEEDNYAFSDS